MAFRTRTNWTTGDPVGSADFNDIGLDLRTWGGNVDAAGYKLVNCAGITPPSAGSYAGKVGINTDTPLTELHVVSPDATLTHRGISVSQHNATTAAGRINIYRSRGTHASPAALADTDQIGVYDFIAYGTAYGTRARIGAIVAGSVTGDTVPTDLYFATGSSAPPTERMRISSVGYVGIGTNAPICALDVYGSLNLAGGMAIAGSIIQAAGGSCSFQTVLVKPASGDMFLQMQDGAPSSTTQIRQSASLVKFTNNALPIEISACTNAGITNQVFLNSTGNVGILTNAPLVALHVNGPIIHQAPTANPGDSFLSNSQMVIWYDEAASNLKFRVRSSAGVLKTGTLAVV